MELKQMDGVLRVHATLKEELGFVSEPDQDIQPYLDYLSTAWPGRGEKIDFLRIFLEVIENLKGGKTTIQHYMEQLVADPHHFYFSETVAGSPTRVTSVTDTVLLVIGTWLLSQSYFIPERQHRRRIVDAYCRSTKQEYSEATAFSRTVSDLINSSGLLPSAGETGSRAGESEEHFAAAVAAEGSLAEREEDPFFLHASVGLLEAFSIPPERLNAVKLAAYGGVKVLWTNNIMRHLLLTHHADTHYLELFALPCAIQGGAERVLSTTGISLDLIDEIESSYATLFNPQQPSRSHRLLLGLPGLWRWCWCLHCSSSRLQNQLLETLKKKSKHGEKRRRRWRYQGLDGHGVVHDPQLGRLMQREAPEWDPMEYKHLWPRILALDAYLQRARPWNLWVLFRDKRETLQYWTFLFGSVILILTVVQVALSIAQVVGTF
ncbi:uncharacterized protein PG998_009058 [Apiospora kogelbergensis]|uniref:uncharacterized protein n=1 Tax=Apiospora kogelbergensis TaxID=1337665 RepID=UPI00312CE973